MPESKTCSRCREPKPRTAFGRDRQTPDGLNYYCRECAAEKQRLWVSANSTKNRAAHEKYREKMREQNDTRSYGDAND